MNMAYNTYQSLTEVSIGAFVILILIIIGSFFVVKSLNVSYKDVFRANSKFDIELRKFVNLLSKQTKSEELKKYDEVTIKDLPFAEKKELLAIVKQVYFTLDLDDVLNKYVVETYNNLQEVRRIRDSKVLIFNQKTMMFPFNLYAKILHFKKWEIFTS